MKRKKPYNIYNVESESETCNSDDESVDLSEESEKGENIPF
jgi:hypothetical protein